jgi:serine phosphatase RsbU (regulator of sigma subunit)
MDCWNILITGEDADMSCATQIGQRLMQSWTYGSTLQVSTVRGSELGSNGIEEAHAVIVVGDAAPSTTTISCLARLEESGVGVLALTDSPLAPANPFSAVGALVERQDISGTTLCALLRGLLHRHREINGLRNEVELAQRFHGGMRVEIDKMHEELQLAAIVQREFLPKDLPKLHGVEFAAMWRPTNYVSGDIYDIMRLDEDHVGVFIADAVGHGVPAALMTMVITRSLETKDVAASSYRIVEPSEVLARLNARMIRRQGGMVRFATAAYAVIDCRTRRMRFAGAGHPPALRIGSDGSSDLLETSGGLLGVFPDEIYEQIELDLAVDDRLLMYSDGFEHAFPEVKDDKRSLRPTERYLDEFRQLNATPGAQEMIELIQRRLNSQLGSLHQPDDLTLICVRSGPLAKVTELTAVA